MSDFVRSVPAQKEICVELLDNETILVSQGAAKILLAAENVDLFIQCLRGAHIDWEASVEDLPGAADDAEAVGGE